MNKQEKQEKGILSSKKVANNTRLTLYTNGDKVLTLHNTDIIKWDFISGRVVLNSGTWRTTTTKRRINQYINAFTLTDFKVYQKSGVWFVYNGREDIEFFDGIEL